MERQLVPIGGGSLQLREEGGKVIFEAARPDDKRGLYKLRLYGRNRGLELGTLLPEQGILRLRRSVSVDRLKAEGCWPVTEAEVVLAIPFSSGDMPPGWMREDSPARLLHGDPLLEHSAQGLSHAFLRREEGFFQLALPYGEGTPFALTPLFCLAKVERLGEKYYIVFSFRENGAPMPPN